MNLNQLTGMRTLSLAFGPLAETYLGRQPIIDVRGALAAYELLFRGNRSCTGQMPDGDLATAQVVENAIGSFGMAGILQDCPGYVNVSRKFLMSEALEVLPPEHFVLEILEDVRFDEPVIERCRALRAAGYRLALDDVSPNRFVPDVALAEIDIVKVDLIATPGSQLTSTIERFLRRGMTVLAEKVETRADFERTKRLGCTLFQGYFFARPEVLQTRRAQAADGPLMRLLNLLGTEPRMDELEEALKATPAVVVQLLRLADAAAGAFHAPVMTLSEAIARVGTDRLMRWIQLLLFARGSDVPLKVNPLVQLVGTRARFMELAARRLVCCDLAPHALPSQAYLVGILSLAPVVLQTSIESFQHDLALAPVIWRAIQSYEGDLGSLLLCAQAIEMQDEALLDNCVRRWPTPHGDALDSNAVAALAIEAAIWANQQAR